MYKAKFKKITLFILIILISFSFTFLPPKQANAMVVSDVLGGVWSGIKWAADKLTVAFRYAYDKGGAVAFQQTLRSALNKIAIDSATWIASGDKGQRPLFITEGTGAYFSNIADEAAGQFIESFVHNWSTTFHEGYESDVKGFENCIEQREACLKVAGQGFIPSAGTSGPGDTGASFLEQLEEDQNRCLQEYSRCTGRVESQSKVTTPPISVCQPSSLDVKLRISLGLVEHVRPRAPTCTASDLVRNWSDEISRLDPRTWDDRDYINRLTGIFHPTQSDLGIALNIQSDVGIFQAQRSRTAELDWMESGRWLDVIGISGSVESLPGQAQMEAQIAQEGRMATFFTHSGDAFIDAANIFINTLALQYYNRLMQGFGKTVDDFQGTSADLADPDIDPSIRFSNVDIEERITRILEPAFNQQSDYNIVSDLSLCPDINNPGPTDCVIDTNFMQAISERKTVIDAVKDGLLRASWQLTDDNNKNKDNAYTLRNISILRKHRILPVGWEIAAELNNGKNATLMDLISCFDPHDDYREFSSEFNVKDSAWCQGLIDPHWVLKSPLIFCKKQGVGNNILNSQIIDGQIGIPNAPDIPSYLSVTRNDNYCADELTCIKEDIDTGSCLVYGYCNEEKRIWTFDDASPCPSVYNTCTAFTGPQGEQLAYLENTLDYGICGQENAGCLQYYTRGMYELDTNQINWEVSPLLYFNNKLASCSEQNEGCSELMRVKPSWGSNLIMGSNFEYDQIGDDLGENSLINDYWPIDGDGVAEIVDGAIAGFSGTKLLRLQTNSTISLYSDNNNSLLPENFSLIPGYSYTFSADVYVQSGDGVKLIIGDDETFSQTTTTGSWQRLFQTYHLDVNNPLISDLEFNIENLEGETVFYLRNLKLEISSWPTNYSPYGSFKFYQKIIPQYLENACYEDVSSATKDYRLRDDAPSICNNFARRCNNDEIGCIMLTNEKYNLSIPAQPVTSDYCPRECENYNVYVAQASHFYNSHAENLIPFNSQVCSANFAGCTEFTNLDDVPSGGERREYYTHLKHCIKPDESRCSSFYTWEGDDESGYQLRVMSLEQEDGLPKLTSPDDTCTEETYNLSPFHPEFNPDCRQFYNQAGQISYGLMSKTITCSENCHTYRITQNNIDNSLNQEACVGVDMNWNNELNHCYVCKNNGVWSPDHQACLYQAIPGEGRPCSSSMVGCREYSGSDGSNVRIVGAYDFLTGPSGWTGYCGHQVETSNVSVSQNGRSLWYQTTSAAICTGVEPNEGIGINLGYNLRQNKSYTIRLLARAGDDDAEVQFFFANTDDEIEDVKFFPETINIKAGEWQIYELNLPNFNRSVDMDDYLIIKSNEDFYIDNITIKEVSDRFYLISNTSQIPDICYYDILDNYQGADYNLGCSRWTDNLGNTHFLRKISRLCDESSVGCELMIETNNSSDWRNNNVCDFSGDHCVDIEGDKFIAVMHDRTKVCSSDNKGCARMGQVQGEGINQLVQNVFKKNNKENYSDILCSEEALGCQEWQTDMGFQYFKDPGNNACVYRPSRDPEVFDSFWFMKDVKRCDLGNGNFGDVCLSNNDCPGSIACVLDETDYPCSVSYFKTIGLGGLNNRVATPNNQAGICSSDFSGCTEYIDPVSQFSSNLILPLSWQGNNQEIRLTPNTLYLFTIDEEADSSASINLYRDAREFITEENIFSEETEDYFEVFPGQHIYFHSQLNGSEHHELATVIGSPDDNIILRPVIVSYQLKQTVDYTSCNSLVNFDKGCVLFNERSVNGASGLSNLIYNAFASEINKPPVNCHGDEPCNANKLIKVSPDRTCGRWLDCMTYAIDPDTNEKTCYNIGECTHLNDNNECANFINFLDNNDEPIVLDPKETIIDNLSGYSLLNRFYLGEMKEVGLNSDFHFEFEHPSQALHCRRDIDTGFIGFPINNNPCSFNNNIVHDSLIIEPNKATTDYPAQGQGYLKVLAYYQISPHSENIAYSLLENEEYYLHYLLNTKDSGLDARVMLVVGDETIWTGTANANNGWERIIHKIDTNLFDLQDEDDYKNIKLYLTSDTNNLEERYVYFDDIHIEPVLKVGPNEYVAKDCRLYPEIDSLSCVSQNEDILRHGLEGYCLEHDIDNPRNCITWYPVDEISSSRLGSSQKLGYQGPQPLYYCAEVNANFEILEKRVANFVGRARWHHSKMANPQDMPNDHWMSCTTNINIEKYGVRLSGDCCEAGHIYDDGSANKMVETLCGGDNNYMVVSHNRVSGSDAWRKDFFCVPKADGHRNERIYSDWKTIDISNGLCTVEYRDVWGVFDGFHRHSQSAVYYASALNTDGFSTSCFADSNHQVGAYDYTRIEECRSHKLNEALNHDPPMAIYDRRNKPIFEEDLKYIAHDNIDKVYQLTCNRFVQLVDPSGANKAWTGRVSHSASPHLTPNFMARLVMESPFYMGSVPDYGVCNWSEDHPQSCDYDWSCSIPCGETIQHLGQDYRTTQIGNQCWFAENLNVTSNRYCYNDNSANCNMYGGLYSWNDAMGNDQTPGSGGICPAGWHIPTTEEVQNLKNYVANMDHPIGYCEWKEVHPNQSNCVQDYLDDDGDIRDGCTAESPDYCEEYQQGGEIICSGINDDYCFSLNNEANCNNNDYCRWIDSDPNPLMSCNQVNSILGGSCRTDNHPRWNEYSEIHGSNSSSFSALPSGGFIGLSYQHLGERFYFWTSSSSGNHATNWFIDITENSISAIDGSISEFTNANKNSRFAVRCIRSDSSCVFDPEQQTWVPPGCCSWDGVPVFDDDDDFDDDYDYPFEPIPIGCSQNYPYCIESEVANGIVHCLGIDYDFCSSSTTQTSCASKALYCVFESDLENNYWIRYGRLREIVPYGGAELPENFDFYSSPAVKLRNQYSERNNQEIFAGRPYGCVGTSCSKIGQCNLNPNVYCILENDFEAEQQKSGFMRINNDSCAKGGYGYCLPLWQGNYEQLRNNFFDYPLKSIFLRSFGGFNYNFNLGKYESAGGYDAENEDYSNEIPGCNNNSRSNPDDWCAVYPYISNIKMVSVETGEEFPHNEFNELEDAGLYYLEFNTFVDIEQQPLKRIEINWGDGSSQVIINQDNRPELNKPHRLFHFYNNFSQIDDFEIKIYDNWDFWGES